MIIKCRPYGKSDISEFEIECSCIAISASLRPHFMDVILDNTDCESFTFHARWYQMWDKFIILAFEDDELKRVINEFDYGRTQKNKTVR